MGLIYYLIFLVTIVLILLKFYVRFILLKYCRSKVCLVGKTVIVTGGNAGIGYETALDLACRGAKVILACRSKERGSAAVEKIIKETHNKNVVLKILDLASIQSVKNFAEDIIKNEDKIDILVNNAGIVIPIGEVTEDGLQEAWQINHFGPMLLTLLLLDTIKKSAPSRIINVSSMAAKYSKLSVQSMNTCNHNFTTYGDTKLANIFFTQELAKKVEGTNVSVFSLHPGAVETEIIPYKNWNLFLKLALRVIFGGFYLNPREGAQTTIYCAVEKGMENLTGSHFEYCNVVKPYKTAQDPVMAKQIWDESLKILKYEKND